MSVPSRAITHDRPGGPEVLTMSPVLIPDPGAGEIRVRIRGSGVNRADLLQRLGRYPVPPGWPEQIPGLEYAGEVEAIGAGVELWKAGDRVMGIVGGGGYADTIVVHERTAMRVPQGIDLLHAAAIPEVFTTAWDAIFLQGAARSGERILIHAVGSGVGSAALQLSRHFGLCTVGTSRTLSKLGGAVDAGLDHPVEVREGWPDEVRRLVGGTGVDLVLDLVGGAHTEESVRLLSTGGRLIVVGTPAGASARIDLAALMRARGRMIGTLLRPRPLEDRIRLARRFERELIPLFEAGALRPVIDRIFPAARVADAHRRMESNEGSGKILLDWRPAEG